MLSKVKSISLIGLEGNLIEIQVDISNGIPEFEIVGLPDTSVKEAKKRIKTAIKNSKFEFPSRKILINLAPANIKKEGSCFDFPMAIGILIATGKIAKLDNTKLEKTILIGELSLDGKLNRINGALAMCIEAKELGIEKVIIPKTNANEVAIIDDLDIIPVSTIEETIKYLTEEISIKKAICKNINSEENYKIDFSEVKGQEMAKRALEIVAAGSHNCLMIGSPGTGKTMLAKRLSTILPDLSLEEILEITKIHSIAGELKKDGLILTRPFRMPHHTAPIRSIIGGGRIPIPGEISLAHKGVLFFDELAEYSKTVLEALREPLEEKEVTINRLNGKYKFPCNFMFVASMNPCPCGYYGDNEKECKCTSYEIHRYLKKISGPLFDRIDIHIEIKRTKIEKLNSNQKAETSEKIKNRVNKARKIQKDRYNNYGFYTNSELPTKLIGEFCKLDDKSNELLQDVFKKLKLSVRGYEKILKVSRTIADLENEKNIKINHLAEAIQYRSLDKF